jgi:hypothetical protein
LKRPTCRYSARLLCNPCHLTFDEALVSKEKKCLKPGDSFKDCPACPDGGDASGHRGNNKRRGLGLFGFRKWRTRTKTPTRTQ